MRRAALLLALLGGALPGAGLGEARFQGRAAEASFQPEVFFAGATRSEGAFLAADGRPADRFTGETRGRREPDGSATFDQTIRFADGSVRQRSWRIVRTGPNAIEATGSEVVGIARGEIGGRTLRLLSTIRLDAGNPLSDVDFEQVMELQSDGRTVTNRSIIRKLGFVVREADERFVRVGGGPGSRRMGR